MRTGRYLAPVLLLVLGSLVALTMAPATAQSAHPRGYWDWITYHKDRGHSGYNPNAKKFTGGLHIARKIRLDGAVYAEPIVARGITIVATENNSIYAFGLANRLLWKRHLGAPSPANQRPCGNIDPLGITGTPVYYDPTGLVYVAPEFSGRPPFHRLYAIRLNGSVAWSRKLDGPGVDQAAMQERGALAVTRGRVWVPFGGLAGDCGAYKGRVVGYSLKGTGAAVSYTVPTAREAGIWTPPGPTVEGAGNMYVAVGNGASGVGDRYDHSDSVLKLNGSARLVDSFSPRTWPTDNDNDLDLGSQGPAIVGPWIFADGKRGTAYVLRRSHLGGIGGQVSTMNLCRSFGGTSTFTNNVWVPCSDGLRAVRIDSAGHMRVLWHTASSITGPPVISPGTIWSIDVGAGVLHALGPWHGVNQGAIAVGAVPHFATPALSGNRVLIGTMTGLTIVAY